jgi:hypothetical protein
VIGESASEVATRRDREEDLCLNLLVKGPIPNDSAPNPTCQFFGSNLVANCAEQHGFNPFRRS